MYKYIAFLFLSIGCSGGYTIYAPDTTHEIVQRGESYTYIVVRLEFLQDVKQLCEDLHFDIPNPQLRRQTVAECTFERLTLLNFDFSALYDVQDQLCSQDPAVLTPDQLQVYGTVCL